MGSGPSREKLLAIYLTDHLAGAEVGTELVRRSLGSNRDDPELGGPLEELRREIEEDRETLERLIDSAGVRRDLVKRSAAWAAEKLGRLKLNGQLTGYSPLSALVELEALCVGVTAKRQLWRALAETLGPQSVPGFDFAALAERAAAQRERIEGLQLIAASRSLPSSITDGAG